MKAKKIDPNTLKKGDLFRGKYWEYGMNHVFLKIDESHYVQSLCNRIFYPDHIYEPAEDTSYNNCYFCRRRRNQ